MHEAMSPENLYLRFFCLSKRVAGHEAQRLCRPAGPITLRPCLPGRQGRERGQLPADREARVAEIAFAVTDDMHHRRVATLPLEHLVSPAATRHLRAFTTQTLTGELAHGAALVDQRVPGSCPRPTVA
jgi:hypothetical protein